MELTKILKYTKAKKGDTVQWTLAKGVVHGSTHGRCPKNEKGTQWQDMNVKDNVKIM